MAEKFIPYAELNENQRVLVDSENSVDRRDAASQGYGLDKLVDDENLNVRRTVAAHGFGLDKLVDDESGYVRCVVADQGYGLDKLVDDPSHGVRCVVAEQGYGLDKLVDDENEYVRRAVARQGYGLDKLVDDESHWVRGAVAEQGYGLDKLVDDESSWVRSAALMALGISPDREAEAFRKARLDLAQEWAAANPDKCALPENRPREEKIGQGQPGREKGTRAEGLEVSPEKMKEILDYFLYGTDDFDRQVLASYGYGLDVLVNDVDEWVRAEVAAQGYGLDKLADDEEESVRTAVSEYLESRGCSLEEWAAANPDRCALEENGPRVEKGSEVQEQPGVEKIYSVAELEALASSDDWEERVEAAERGFGLDKLVDDPHWFVRMTVAKQGYGLDTLAADSHSLVRKEAAKQGFGLDLLAKDEHPWMGVVVSDYLREAGVSLEEWIAANPDRCALPENRARGERNAGHAKTELGRVPSELKSAPGKPALTAAEAATPAEDGRACSASAAARGVEARSADVKRQK